MRITNGMMVDNFLANMQTNLAKMDRFQSQLTTGRKIVRLSDDPIGVYNALTARQRLQRYEQYQANLITARNWSEQCESSVKELSGKLADIKEQVTYAATNIKNGGDRENIAALMEELRDSVMDALNTTVGDQYLFSGFNTVNKPLTLDTTNLQSGQPTVLYNGIDLSNITDQANVDKIQKEQDQHFQLEVGYGLQMDVTMTAIEVVGVGDNNLFKNINEIIGLMHSGDESSTVVEKLSSKLGNLSKAHENITSCLAKVGAMSTQIEVLDARYAEDVINYNKIRAEIEDIDSAETIMDFKMAEAIYKQSLSTGARVIMPTLMDFLR